MPSMTGDSAAPGEPPQLRGLEGLPRELEEHLLAELAVTQEPGWLERYKAEVEARRQHGPTLAPRR